MNIQGAPQLLASTLRTFINWRKDNRLPPSKSRTFNIIYHDPTSVAADDFRFDVGCVYKEPLAENEAGLVNKVIPEGACAKIRYIGSDDNLGLAIDDLYQQWLPQSGAVLMDYPLFVERVSFFLKWRSMKWWLIFICR